MVLSLSCPALSLLNCLLIKCTHFYTADINLCTFFSYERSAENRIVLTLKCLSIGTPNLINFPFVSNGKLMVFRCPNIQAHYNEAVLCLKFGTPENNEFSICFKWKIYYF